MKGGNEMTNTKAKKVDSYRQEQAWRELSREQTTITADQLAGFYAVCDEFGEGFNGIRDRANNVARDMSNAENVVELLTSVNPLITARIMGYPTL